MGILKKRGGRTGGLRSIPKGLYAGQARQSAKSETRASDSSGKGVPPRYASRASPKAPQVHPQRRIWVSSFPFSSLEYTPPPNRLYPTHRTLSNFFKNRSRLLTKIGGLLLGRHIFDLLVNTRTDRIQHVLKGIESLLTHHSIPPSQCRSLSLSRSFLPGRPFSNNLESPDSVLT